MPNSRKNIAILSAGRRVELVQAFLEQQEKNAPKSKVFALDMNPALSSACQVAHASFQCPAATSSEYREFLDDFLTRNEIGLVIPTIDTELMVLSQNRSVWAQSGSFVSISDTEIITLCRDKRRSGQLFNLMGIRYPDLYTAENCVFPAFSKPVSGSSSKGARLIHHAKELGAEGTDKAFMLMEYIGPPYVEFSIDVYFDRNSQLLAAVPRKRLETRAGEISKGLTVKGDLYSQLVAALKTCDGMRGCITLQVFYDEQRKSIVGIEINPRFGGGYPLSHSAGANYPGWLIQEYLLNETPQFYDGWEESLLMLRYDAKVLVHNATA